MKQKEMLPMMRLHAQIAKSCYLRVSNPRTKSAHLDAK